MPHFFCKSLEENLFVCKQNSIIYIASLYNNCWKQYFICRVRDSEKIDIQSRVWRDMWLTQ